MKNFSVATAAILSFAAPISAISADTPIIQPGMYEVTVGISGNDMKTHSCFSDNDVKDLRAIVLTLEEPLMRKNCAVKVLKESVDKAEWRMDCQSVFVKRTTVGTISWGPTQFSGESVRTMGAIQLESTLDAKRVGDCK